MISSFYNDNEPVSLLSLNPDPLGSKNITIHYPGAIFGTFIINHFTWSLFLAFLIFNCALIQVQEISNPVTLSLFWHFLKD